MVVIINISKLPNLNMIVSDFSHQMADASYLRDIALVVNITINMIAYMIVIL